MYLMAALLLIALVANALMKPVASRHYMQAADAEGFPPSTVPSEPPGPLHGARTERA